MGLPTPGDRGGETTLTIGLLDYDLAGQMDGWRTLVEAHGDGKPIHYLAIPEAGGVEYEVGEGIITAGAPDVLSRVTIFASSNGNSKVNWGTGVKRVVSVFTAEAFNQLLNRANHTGTQPVSTLSDYIDWQNAVENLFTTGSLETSKVILSGGTSPEGEMYWDDAKDSVVLDRGSVNQDLGQEVFLPLSVNDTLSTITKGTPVYFSGHNGTNGLIKPMIADGSIDQKLFIGLAAEDIAAGATGFVEHFGAIDGVDTTAYSQGDLVYVSDTVAGELTATKPNSPSDVIIVGAITIVGVSGRIFVRHNFAEDSVNINYNNVDSGLLASNLKSAIDELEFKKADLGELSSNITLYGTSVLGDFTYNRMVTETTDADYDTPEFILNTGSITGANQFIQAWISDAGLIEGNPGAISVPNIANIAKTVGNSNKYAEFYVEIYKRDSGGTETLIGTTASSGPVNPPSLNVFSEYSASTVIDSTTFTSTDRIVTKLYGTLLSGTDATYDFKLGGGTPARTLFAVPVSVIPASDASDILADTSNFNGLLSGADSSVQNALETLDDYAPAWGDITGTLSNQTDLQNALDAAGLKYSRKTANYTAVTGEGIVADTSGGTFTVTLPATPAIGDYVVIADGADWSTTNLTVGRNGSTIEGATEDLTMDVGGVLVTFIYDGTTWEIFVQTGGTGSNILVTSDIGVTVQGYDADTPTVVATQAEAEAATSTSIRTFTPQRVGQAIAANAANQELGNLGVTGRDKIPAAWVNFNGEGTVAINDSYNVSSITDNGVGDYSINFSNALTDTNYSFTFGLKRASTAGSTFGYVCVDRAVAPTTSALTINTANSAANVIDVESANCQIFGAH